MNAYHLGRILVRILIVAVAIALPLVRFVTIDAHSHSASDTLRPWIVEVAVIELLAGFLWLAVDRFVRDRSRAR